MLHNKNEGKKIMLKNIVVTGGSGRLGTWVIKEFLEKGYHVINVDWKQPTELLTKTVVANLENLGEVYHCLAGADAVIHMAAIPNPFKNPNDVVYRNNVMSTFHILEACANLGIKKVVLGSSEASYGICNAPIAPQYVPLDEEHPQLPQDCYGLSKIVNEVTAQTFHRRTNMQVVCMRLGNVITPEMYANFPAFINDGTKRAHLLWSYIDARDAASACRLAVETDGLGCVSLNIAADNTSMNITSSELMSKKYPDVTDIRSDISAYQTILDNKKAKQLLNWQPIHNWRDYVVVK